MLSSLKGRRGSDVQPRQTSRDGGKEASRGIVFYILVSLLVVLVVLLAVMVLSTHLVEPVGRSLPTSINTTHRLQQLHEQTDQADNIRIDHREQYAAGRYVLTTFFSPPQGLSFYPDNRVTSLEWIYVFLLSLRNVTSAREQDTQLPPWERKTKVIFFIDVPSFIALWEQSDEMQALVESGFLHFVVVVSWKCVRTELPECVNALAHIPSVPGVEVVYPPSYIEEAWAAGYANGANSFRLAFYRDWLERYASFSVTSPCKNAKGNSSIPGGCDAIRDSRFILSDNTDVAFQRDPFVDLQDSEYGSGWEGNCFQQQTKTGKPYVVFTMESNSKTFLNEHYNRRWMSCYGQEVLRRLAKVRAGVSCAGIVLGNGAGLVGYLYRQLKEIRSPLITRCAVHTIHASLDQGTHNYILHERFNRLPFLKLVISHERHACAFHGNFGTVNLNSAGDVVLPGRSHANNDSLAVYAIVHQFTNDRQPLIMNRMHARYLAKG